MSKVKIQGNASGTGVLTIEAPNTNTDRTLTLPDEAGELLTTTGDGSQLTGISSGAWSVKSSGTFSGVSSLDITGLTKTTKVFLTNLTGSVDTADLYMRTSTNNGTSFDSGASDYFYSYLGSFHSNGNTVTGGTLTATEFRPKLNLSSTLTTANGCEFTLFDPAAATQTVMECLSIKPSAYSRQATGGRSQTSGAVNAISFFSAASGTISGTYVVLELN